MRRWLPTVYLLGALLFAGCQPPGPRALLDGERLIGEGKYAEAIARLQVAVQNPPTSTNAQAWNHLGLAHQYAGQPVEALRAYQQAVSLDRNLSAIRFNLGNLHLEQNRLEDAIGELTSCTVLDPNNTSAWLLLGKAQLRARKIDDAERVYANVVRLDPNNAEALNYQGVVQLHRRRTQNAKAFFDAALAKQPGYPPAILNQAIYYHYYVINKTNALAKYREYLAMKPDEKGAAAASAAMKALEAEFAPKPVLVAVTNAPPSTNRVAVVVTNSMAPLTNRPVAALTNRTQTNVAAALHQTNKTVAIATNKPVAAPVVATNTPPPEKKVAVAVPPPVTNAPPVEKQLALAEVATNTPAPPRIEEKKVEPKPEPKPEVKAEPPPKPLEVVRIDDDQPVIAVAKDIAAPRVEPKPKPQPAAAPATNKPVAVSAIPQTTPAAASKPASEPPPLIRPAARPQKEKEPGFTTRMLDKANPVNWFKRDKEKDKDETPLAVAKKPEPKAADLETLPEPPPAPKPEPVFPRYPYQTVPLPIAGNRAAAEPLFNEAVVAHQDNKLGKAMDGYRAALRYDARFYEAQLNLGIAAAQANDLSLALASFEDAVRVKPDSIDARYEFAMSLRRANYPQDSANELKVIIEEKPAEVRAHLALANLYAQVLNKPEEAVAHYNKVLQLQPQHPQAGHIRAWLAQH